MNTAYFAGRNYKEMWVDPSIALTTDNFSLHANVELELSLEKARNSVLKTILLFIFALFLCNSITPMTFNQMGELKWAKISYRPMQSLYSQ